jgi:hypothetical protein
MRAKIGIRAATCGAVTALVAALAAGAGASAPAIPRPPQLLSQTGLYAGPGTARISPSNLHYAPQYPLWSDGARKSRWAYIPPGKQIDARETDAWTFPVGTKFWKEFDFGARKVETRLLWKVTPSEWVFATYLWSTDQSDAALAPAEGVPDYAEIAPGKRHSIPGVLDCKACHDSRRTEILGFTALQLSTDRDPNAPHAEPLGPDMVTLQTLEEKRLLSPSRADLVRTPPRIPAANARTRSSLGYLAVNCGVCHNPDNPLAALGMLLQHASDARAAADEPALQTALAVKSRWAIPQSKPGETLRLAPGDPARSAILYRMHSRRPASQMPPLGTAIEDTDAVQLLSQWVRDDLQAAPRVPASSSGAGGTGGAESR